jgi:hypothetical protein
MPDHIITLGRNRIAWPLFGCAAVLLCLLLGAVLDEPEPELAAQADIERALGVAEGRRLATDELRPVVASAYRRGREDAQREATAYCRELRP